MAQESAELGDWVGGEEAFMDYDWYMTQIGKMWGTMTWELQILTRPLAKGRRRANALQRRVGRKLVDGRRIVEE